MINLIPKEEKKSITKGFYYRMTVLLLVMAGTFFLIFFVAILPSYFLASEKNNIVNTKLEAQKSEPVPLPDQQTLDTIKDLNKKVALIEKAESSKFLVSQKVVSAIILKKILGIKITDISYKNDPLLGKTVNLEGTAPSRESLLLFRQALQDDTTFKNVDLPISNFVKGSNIQFYLSLIPA